MRRTDRFLDCASPLAAFPGPPTATLAKAPEDWRSPRRCARKEVHPKWFELRLNLGINLAQANKITPSRITFHVSRYIFDFELACRTPYSAIGQGPGRRDSSHIATLLELKGENPFKKPGFIQWRSGAWKP